MLLFVIAFSAHRWNLMMHRVRAIGKGCIVSTQPPLMDISSALCSDYIQRDKETVWYIHVIYSGKADTFIYFPVCSLSMPEIMLVVDLIVAIPDLFW